MVETLVVEGGGLALYYKNELTEDMNVIIIEIIFENISKHLSGMGFHSRLSQNP